MGGINIRCGSFSGTDKSGSALGGVLRDMAAVASAEESAVLGRLTAAFDAASEYIFIEADDARRLLPLLRRYSDKVDAQLPVPGDPLDQIAREEGRGDVDLTELKYGAGLGWRAYCARDLLRAFEGQSRSYSSGEKCLTNSALGGIRKSPLQSYRLPFVRTGRHGVCRLAGRARHMKPPT